MKNILKGYLCIIVIIIAFAVQDEHSYAADGGTFAQYTGSDTVVTVPSTFKIIGSYAFSKCTFIEEIIIPEGVTRIEDGAFYECKNLKKLSLPSTLTTIEDSIFYHCNSLKNVTIPKSVTSWDFDDSEEYYNDGLEAYQVDPANPQFSSIDGVVYDKAMTSVLYYPQNKKNEVYTLPDSVIDISKVDFSHAKYLKHIIFNTKVNMGNEESYDFAFGFLNDTLERFTVPEQNETFCDIDGVLFTKDRKSLLAYPKNKPGEFYRIPEGTEKIDSPAFDTNREEPVLKYILFPSSIKTIEDIAILLPCENSCPSWNFTLFGKKGSVAESYAKFFGFPFSSYDPLNKETQLLLTASDLFLTSKERAKLNPVFLTTSTDQLITWKSSDSSIATVDQKGNISAKKLGTAIISASTKNGSTATCKVNVTLPAPKDLKLISGASSGRVFTWKKVPGAVSYTLYRTNASANYNYHCIGSGDLSALRDPITKLGTTTRLTFTDSKPTINSDFDYFVIANHVDSRYNSKFSNIVYVYLPLMQRK